MHGYLNWSHALLRKAVIGVVIIVGFTLADAFIGRTLPTSFLPEEDYGYAMLHVQLPPAASLERTDEVLKKVEKILGQTEGVQYYTGIGGFSLLNRISASYQGFFFMSFKPWDERTSHELQAQTILAKINGALATQIPEAMAFAFMPPSIPGLGSAGGFSLWLQDRSGGSVEFLDQNLQAFLAAARKRPELAGVMSQFSADVPQIYRRRRSRQSVEAGCGCRRCLSNVAGVSRWALSESVQSLRPAVARVSAVRGRHATQ